MIKINIYLIFAMITWLLANIFIPLLRNSIERVYKNQIDLLLTSSLCYLKVICWKFLQIVLFLFFWPTLFSKIPNFMRAEAQKEYEPVAEALLDRNFPRKMLVSWNMVRGTIFTFGLIIAVIVTSGFIYQFRK